MKHYKGPLIFCLITSRCLLEHCTPPAVYAYDVITIMGLTLTQLGEPMSSLKEKYNLHYDRLWNLKWEFEWCTIINQIKNVWLDQMITFFYGVESAHVTCLISSTLSVQKLEQVFPHLYLEHVWHTLMKHNFVSEGDSWHITQCLV